MSFERRAIDRIMANGVRGVGAAGMTYILANPVAGASVSIAGMELPLAVMVGAATLVSGVAADYSIDFIGGPQRLMVERKTAEIAGASLGAGGIAYFSGVVPTIGEGAKIGGIAALGSIAGDYLYGNYLAPSFSSNPRNSLLV